MTRAAESEQESGLFRGLAVGIGKSWKVGVEVLLWSRAAEPDLAESNLFGDPKSQSESANFEKPKSESDLAILNNHSRSRSHFIFKSRSRSRLIFRDRSRRPSRSKSYPTLQLCYYQSKLTCNFLMLSICAMKPQFKMKWHLTIYCERLYKVRFKMKCKSLDFATSLASKILFKKSKNLWSNTTLQL